MDERRSFFDSSASTWDESLERELRIEKLGAMVEQFRIGEGDAILDVGTGTGVLLPLLGKAVGPGGTVIAIDFALEMLRAATRHDFEMQPTFINAGVAAIPFREGSFDKVTCFSAFPHFPDKKRALAEMVRVLRKGGSLFIAHLHSVKEIAKLHHEVGGSVHMDRLPDSNTMANLMTEAGLAGVMVENEPGKFLAHGRKD